MAKLRPVGLKELLRFVSDVGVYATCKSKKGSVELVNVNEMYGPGERPEWRTGVSIPVEGGSDTIFALGSDGITDVETSFTGVTADVVLDLSTCLENRKSKLDLATLSDSLMSDEKGVSLFVYTETAEESLRNFRDLCKCMEDKK